LARDPEYGKDASFEKLEFCALLSTLVCQIIVPGRLLILREFSDQNVFIWREYYLIVMFFRTKNESKVIFYRQETLMRAFDARKVY